MVFNIPTVRFVKWVERDYLEELLEEELEEEELDELLEEELEQEELDDEEEDEHDDEETAAYRFRVKERHLLEHLKR